MISILIYWLKSTFFSVVKDKIIFKILLGSSGGWGGVCVCCVETSPKELEATTLLPVAPAAPTEELVVGPGGGAEIKLYI